MSRYPSSSIYASYPYCIYRIVKALRMDIYIYIKKPDVECLRDGVDSLIESRDKML